MTQRHTSWGVRVLGAIALTISSTMLVVPNASSETYIGGQLGVALPSLGGQLSNIDVNSSVLISGVRLSDLELSTSLTYGGKVGHYFDFARWFGVEAEVFYTTPHIEQQVHTFSHPTVPCPNCSETLQGAHFRVLTFAPFNLMFRYHKARLQPYLGVGPGIFFSRIQGEGATPGSTETVSDNAQIGLNAKAGLQYYITQHLTVFGEWKFNYARFNFDENQSLFPFPYGFNATYTMHFVSFGVGYHF